VPLIVRERTPFQPVAMAVAVAVALAVAVTGLGLEGFVAIRASRMVSQRPKDGEDIMRVEPLLSSSATSLSGSTEKGKQISADRSGSGSDRDRPSLQRPMIVGRSLKKI
jgi:hypothetical protein